MPLHPACEVMINAAKDLGLDNDPSLSPQQRREAMHNIAVNTPIPKQDVFDVEDHAVPSPIGRLPVRVYRPSDQTGLGVLVFFHGGGWVTGDLDTHDQMCRLLCHDAGIIVASVDYRLAPEDKFPAAVDDCLAAYEWTTRHARDIGGDFNRVAIGGDSAGGNLAAVVALLARDDEIQPPVLQLLVYPFTEYEFESSSMIDNAKGYMLEAESVRWFTDHYARMPKDFDDWRFSPMRAPSLRSLPPAVVITAEFDPLRDQGEAYGHRLQKEGVPTQVIRADGVIHGFFGWHAFLPPAQESWDLAIAALRSTLGGA